MQSETIVVDVSRDWAAACDVQERFLQLPGATIDALRYSARCRQVRALGGDCYDFMPLPGNRLALAVADACGNGLAAALMISNVQSSLRTAAGFTGNDVAAVVGAVNRQVHASSPADRHATLFYGVFAAAARTLRYVNAGHNPPLVIRLPRTIARLEAGGPPVGAFSDSAFEEGEIQLEPGDLVIAHTDGVTEAMNPAGHEWGVEGLRNVAIQSSDLCADDLVDAIFASLDEFSLGCQWDDATVLVMRVR
ncbi:MAG TPA: PP2C family protein-serine/threonine phosphatase [Candidatus Limnocylindrales bacterium]|nr:PP2C family protein-serine/threonine phosphatase [Candidatus Limnocylindrales bacterium]